MAAALGAAVEGGEGVEAARVGGGGSLMRSRWEGEGARGGRGGGAGVRAAGGRWRKKGGAAAGGRRGSRQVGPTCRREEREGGKRATVAVGPGNRGGPAVLKKKEKDRRERGRRVGRRV
jgi:hypothetical protein